MNLPLPNIWAQRTQEDLRICVSAGVDRTTKREGLETQSEPNGAFGPLWSRRRP
jgi:hypothetical protein